MNARVVVDEDTGVQQPLRVESVLDPPHQPVNLLSPLHLHERRHVPPRPVLPLEGSVVLPDDHIGHRVHEPLVPRHLLRVAEILGKDEVQIPVQGVAENDPLVVPVAPHELLELQGGVGEALDREHHVLDDHGGADPPPCSNGREESLADQPQLLVLRLPVGEGDREDGRDPREHSSGLSHLPGETRRVPRSRLDKERRRVPAEGLQVFRHPLLVLD